MSSKAESALSAAAGPSVDLEKALNSERLDVWYQPKIDLAKKVMCGAEAMLQVLLERERLGSTGIGEGIAIPHGKLQGLDEILLSFGRSSEGISFDAMDGKPVHLFFLLMAPENSAGLHLKILAKISRMLKDPALRDNLLRAMGKERIWRIIEEQEQKT